MVTKIRSCIWCDGNAKEMAEYYADVFPDTTVGHIQYYTADQPDFNKHMVGQPLIVELTLGGQEVILLNAGSEFPASEYFSLEVVCEDQAEIDRVWDRLVGDGGEESVCGWCKDKFGTNFQVTPQRYYELIADPATENAVNGVIYQMKKIIIADLEAAAVSH
ncbi:MAG: VOC family protein [Thermomicrobiales bacterium]|nr:VOC family protein [Thermomicrobiales bacterium]